MEEGLEGTSQSSCRPGPGDGLHIGPGGFPYDFGKGFHSGVEDLDLPGPCTFLRGEYMGRPFRSAEGCIHIAGCLESAAQQTWILPVVVYMEYLSK